MQKISDQPELAGNWLAALAELVGTLFERQTFLEVPAGG
jgi:hypothetical protein